MKTIILLAKSTANCSVLFLADENLHCTSALGEKSARDVASDGSDLLL